MQVSITFHTEAGLELYKRVHKTNGRLTCRGLAAHRLHLLRPALQSMSRGGPFSAHGVASNRQFIRKQASNGRVAIHVRAIPVVQLLAA